MKLKEYIVKHFKGNISAFAAHNGLVRQHVSKIVAEGNRLVTEKDGEIRISIEFKSHLSGIAIKRHDWVGDFDIGKYKFYDKHIGSAKLMHGGVLVIGGDYRIVDYKKLDVIAMAKSLGVTKADFK